MREQKSSIFIYLAVICVNLHTFCTSNVYSWTSPSLPILRSNNTDINPLGRSITNLEESWIVSLQLLGSLMGTILAGYCSKTFGSKNSLIISSIPFIIGYIIIAHSKSAFLFCIARFITGACAIFSATLIPSYIAEISLDHNRGVLCGISGTIFSLGNLMNFFVGPLCSIQTMAYIVLSIMILFLVTFVPFVPDSPYRYIRMQKNERAEKCLKKLRGNSDVKGEIETIYNLLSHDKLEEPKVFKAIFTSSSIRRALVICLSLLLFQMLTGYGFLSIYLQTVIEATDDTIPFYAVSMIVGILQTVAYLTSNLFIDKLGRKKLMYISAVGCSLAMFSLGIYFFLKSHKYNIDSIFWLPLVTLSVFFISFGVGIGPIPITITGELFSSNVKSVCLTITFMCSMASGFLYTAGLPFLLSNFGLDAMFCFCGVIGILTVIFLKLFVPETAGKSFEEIQSLLSNKK